MLSRLHPLPPPNGSSLGHWEKFTNASPAEHLENINRKTSTFSPSTSRRWLIPYQQQSREMECRRFESSFHSNSVSNLTTIKYSSIWKKVPPATSRSKPENMAHYTDHWAALGESRIPGGHVHQMPAVKDGVGCLWDGGRCANLGSDTPSFS